MLRPLTDKDRAGPTSLHRLIDDTQVRHRSTSGGGARDKTKQNVSLRLLWAPVGLLSTKLLSKCSLKGRLYKCTVEKRIITHENAKKKNRYKLERPKNARQGYSTPRVHNTATMGVVAMLDGSGRSAESAAVTPARPYAWTVRQHLVLSLCLLHLRRVTKSKRGNTTVSEKKGSTPGKTRISERWVCGAVTREKSRMPQGPAAQGWV